MSNKKPIESAHRKIFTPDGYGYEQARQKLQIGKKDAAVIRLKTRLSHYFEEFKKVIFKVPPAERAGEMKFLDQCWKLEVGKHADVIDVQDYKGKFNELVAKWLAEQTANARKS